MSSKRSIVRESRFRHLTGEIWKNKFDSVRPANKVTEAPGVRGNRKWVATAWESGGGGVIAVLDATKPERISGGTDKLPLLHGHQGAILDFEFSPFNEDMLATASEDGCVRVFKMPEEEVKKYLTLMISH